MQPRFPLGKTYATPGALVLILYRLTKGRR